MTFVRDDTLAFDRDGLRFAESRNIAFGPGATVLYLEHYR